jgi:3-hydroxybutyrate dehydrogenase
MLKGKVALITGSTSGIGLGIAIGLAKAGAKIMLNGMGEASAIEALRADMAKTYGVEVLFHGADLSKPLEIKDLIFQTQDRLGGLDILVNNAGIQHVAPIETYPPEKWDAIIAINLSAAFHTTRLCFDEMKTRKWGRIINMASAHALVASPFKSAYVAAKHGIAGLTKTVALEGAEFGITCNAVCPGYVLTPLVEKQIPDTAKARGMTEAQVIKDVLLAAQPTKQFVETDDIAELVIFLCTDASKAITGTLLPIDGGWTAH